MPEIKHTFTAGKMNKDLDERLVPNGEYRDASNIQVRTTDGDAAGTVQGIKGNTSIGSFTNVTNPETKDVTKTVGSVVDEKNDNIYFFMAAPKITSIALENVSGTTIFTDCIIEQNVDGTTTPVVVDEHTIITTAAIAFTSESSFGGYDSQNTKWYEVIIKDDTIKGKLRVGMKMELIDVSGENKIPNAVIKTIYIDTAGDTRIVFHTGYKIDAVSPFVNDGSVWVKFSGQKVLNFDYDSKITSINIIDNLLFWTDGLSEPKKINIDRCKAGTPTFVEEEYVINGGFTENITLSDDWEVTGGVTKGYSVDDNGNVVTPSVYNSSNAPLASTYPNQLYINGLQHWNTSNDTNNGEVRQIINDLTPGDTYVYSLDYNVISGILTTDLNVAVDQNDTLAGSGTYTHTFTAASDTLNIHIYGTLATPASDGAVEAYIDNVSVLSSASSTYSHTKLYVQDPTDVGSEIYIPITDVEHYTEEGDGIDDNLKEEHITVMRKAPRRAPTLVLNSTDRGEGLSEVEIDNSPFLATGGGDTGVATTSYINPNDTRVFSHASFSSTVFRVNDVLTFTAFYEELGSDASEVIFSDTIIVTCKFISYVDSNGEEISESTEIIKVEVLYWEGNDGNIPFGLHEWSVKLKQKAPLFELKLGRFAYRYRYEDGEYSSIGPWSELAFLPGAFKFEADEGHNVGMKNIVREIIVKDFIPFNSKPLDVKSIDLVYKTTDSNNIHVVKTISRGVDGEWDLFTPKLNDTTNKLSGQLSLSSEMIHKLLPESQALRAWDNVPRYAKAQEITANRLLFSNYVQGYDIQLPVGLSQEVISEVIQDVKSPHKSIKSLRDYKWGIVFGDKYGRETPVFSSGYTSGYGDTYTSLTGDIHLGKDSADKKSHFKLKQIWDNPVNSNNTPPSWADYVKYYIKETSNEYYNLVLNRWYWGDENMGTIWLSFNSADRNKVDEETYIIAKNKNGETVSIKEQARYKIIAIENDAPDYIKTKQNDIGRVILYAGTSGTDQSVWESDSGSYLNGNSTEETVQPSALLDESTPKMIKIKSQTWDGLFGGGHYDGADSARPTRDRAKISMQIVGEDDLGNKKYSKWNEVTNYRSNETTVSAGFGSGVYNYYDWFEIFFADHWDSSADMWYRFTNDPNLPYTVGGTVTGLRYYAQFKEEVIENKPEFDGKFFVKIKADSLIQSNVTKTITEFEKFVTIGTWQIAYIESKDTNQADSGPRMGETWTWGAESDENGDWWYKKFKDVDDWTTLENGSDWDEPQCSGYGSNCYSNGPISTAWADNSCSNGSQYFSNPSECTFYETSVPGSYGCDPSSCTLVVPNSSYSDGGAMGSGFGWYAYKENTGSFWATRWLSVGSQPFIDAAKSASFALTYGLFEGELLLQSTAESWGFNSTVPDNGTKGGMAIAGLIPGSFGVTGWSYAGASYSSFYEEIRKPGQFFRFQMDPDNIYRTVQRAEYPYEPTRNLYRWEGSYPGGIVINESGGYNNVRLGFVIYFRKVDQITGELINEGIDTSVFDPRGQMRHDGSVSIGIEILRHQEWQNKQIVFSTDTTVFETEPKEDVDLDIYYEGSNSLPLILNEDNINDFAPIGCGVSTERTNHMSTEDITLPGETTSDLISNPLNKVANTVGRPTLFNNNVDDIIDVGGDIEYGIGDPIIHITNTDINNNVTTLSNGIYIGDNLVFYHKDGSKLRSKVTGFFDKTNSTNSTGDVIATRYTPSVIVTGKIQVKATNITTDTPTASGGSGLWDPAVGEVLYTVSLTDASNIADLTVGMQLVLATKTGETDNLADLGIVITAIDDTSSAEKLTLSSELTDPFYFQDSNGDRQTYDDFTTAAVDGVEFDVEFIKPTGYYSIDRNVWKYAIDLDWFNCYSYGTGVESDRIRDDFNAPQIDNGVKVSTTFSGYGKENRTSGLIYSGLYNSTSEVNNLNEFNMSQKITKDLNPSYGSIQRLKTRDTDVIVFTEDKVLKILSSKDALFNADGNPQLTASNRVLGTAIPFVGDYGISKNPESLAWDQYRMYFTDKQRGAVLRLSQDGLTPISNVGMKTWFRDNLKLADSAQGSYDIVSGEYNLTLTKTEGDSNYDTTISFSEESKGWVSFKTFLPEAGGSVSGLYITAKGNTIWQHYTNSIYNSFYDTTPLTNSKYESSLSILFNDIPDVIKSFNSINYEGSQSKIVQNTSDTSNYYNLQSKNGWYVNSIETDKQSGTIPEFIEKEGKWFNKINGTTTTLSNLDTGEFTVQGIGNPSIVSSIYIQ